MCVNTKVQEKKYKTPERKGVMYPTNLFSADRNQCAEASSFSLLLVISIVHILLGSSKGTSKIHSDNKQIWGVRLNGTRLWLWAFNLSLACLKTILKQQIVSFLWINIFFSFSFIWKGWQMTSFSQELHISLASHFMKHHQSPKFHSDA